MRTQTADVVICGAGISGISAAYHLAVHHGVQDIVLIDEREPLTFTSDKSTECYRNWWPGPGDTMVRFMNRSIDLLEEMARASDNYFGLNRRGYVYFTTRPEQAQQFQETAAAISALGAGPLRIHHGRAGDPPYTPHHAEGFENQPTGADLILDPAKIRALFPFINEDVIAMLHTRRSGWLSAQQLGMYMLNAVRARGGRLLAGRLTEVERENGRIAGVFVDGADGTHSRIATRTFVNAAGPLINDVAGMIGVELPVFNELHGKVSMGDPQGVIPRDAPLLIWNDPVQLLWHDAERAELAADPDTRWLTETFPAGVHFRPEGAGDSPILLMLWTYHLQPEAVRWPPTFAPEYPEVVLRGLARMAPGLAQYAGRMVQLWVDGGYYCKTQENRPLIGPLPVAGAYLLGAVSGFGIMCSQSAGELLAAHVTGSTLPDYAPAFQLERYEDPAYRALLDSWDATSGQL